MYKKLITVLALVSLVFAGNVFAGSLPEAGSNFDNAPLLKAGEFEDIEMDAGNVNYYTVDLNAGEEIKFSAHLTGDSKYGGDDFMVGLYDENRELIAGKEGLVDYTHGGGTKVNATWIPNGSQESYDYYLKIGCPEDGGEGINIKSFSVSFQERYDAGSGTDAGENLGNPLEISEGEYEGFILQADNEQADVKDFYKMDINQGEKVIMKLTPPAEAGFQLVLYNEKRQMTASGGSSNPGAIAEAEAVFPESSSVYTALMCVHGCEGGSSYSLSLKTEKAPEAESGSQDSSFDGSQSGDQSQVPDFDEEDMENMGEQAQEAAQKAEESFKEAQSWIKKGFKGILLSVILPIIGGIIGFIILIVVIVVIIKKNKNNKKE